MIDQAPGSAASPRAGTPERLAIDTIRTLAMDAVQKANSGHPGTPMALAGAIYRRVRPGKSPASDEKGAQVRV